MLYKARGRELGRMEWELREARHLLALTKAELSESRAGAERLGQVIEDHRRREKVLAGELEQQNRELGQVRG